MKRNRAEGWQHAKLSGHDNESLIETYLENKMQELSKSLGKTSQNGKANIGGLCEKSVESVLGDKTKSKTDLYIKWDDNTYTNISIKKSRGGQVYLIGTERFIRGYEKLFQQNIPEKVKQGLCYFFGDSSDILKIIELPEMKNVVDEKIYQYQKRKHRLVWKTLKLYNLECANELLSWFKNNIGNITIFCFASGLAKNKTDWADFVWYKNLLGEDDMDLLISINDLVNNIGRYSSTIKPGTRGGGTTIMLPFGFVQWHQGKMQFHHKYESILNIIK